MRPTALRLILPGIVLAILFVDRLTKIWAQNYLMPAGAFEVLPFFHLTYVENTGAAWGMFAGRSTLLIGISVALLGGLLFFRKAWMGENDWCRYGTALVVGGAIGNLYDRVVYGFVVDFFDFLVWPVFNVADSCITVGACCLAWGLHLADKKAAPSRR